MINYYLITKPGIIMGNLITVAAGFLLATKGPFSISLFLYTLLGIAAIIASACVFNNYIDRHLDKKMERTKNRPLAQGLISKKRALFFATMLFLLGNLDLFFATNILTLLVANTGFLIYVLLYSFWKDKTIHATLIGSISGATPPVIGYTAVSNHFDMGALILFTILVSWQMPHFFSIAIYRFNDYTKAALPILPILKGIEKTKKQMLAYIITFVFSCSLLTFYHYSGYIYLFVATFLGVFWLILMLRGFKATNLNHWGRQMFRFSLLTITILCIAISFF